MCILYILKESHEIVEDIKAKSREVMLSSDGDQRPLFNPSFTQHVLSVSGSISSSEPKNVTAHHLQSLTAAVYIEVRQVTILNHSDINYMLYITVVLI